MTTWKTRPRDPLDAAARSSAYPLERVPARTSRATPPIRVPGTAVFMTGSGAGTPPTLLHNLKHNKVLHDAGRAADRRHRRKCRTCRPSERVEHRAARRGFYRRDAALRLHGGPERPGGAQAGAASAACRSISTDTTFFLGRETLIATAAPAWRSGASGCSRFMSRNAHRATAFFRIPPDRVVELGMQIEL